MTEREFTLPEARALMPQVHLKAAEIIRLRADLAELALDLRTTGTSPLGAIPELKSHEATLTEALDWFPEQGILIKSVAPLLIDFPSTLDTRSIQLCWLEGEPNLSWYHLTQLGFTGRRPLEQHTT